MLDLLQGFLLVFFCRHIYVSYFGATGDPVLHFLVMSPQGFKP